MAPPCFSFPASELPVRVHEDVTGRRRKLEGGARQIDLTKCELLKIVQYECEVKEPIRTWSSINCYPIERLFRRCQDKNGPFMVESTAWERQRETGGTSESTGDLIDSSSTAK